MFFKNKNKKKIQIEEKQRAIMILSRITETNLATLRGISLSLQIIESLEKLGIDSAISLEELGKLGVDNDALIDSIRYYHQLKEKVNALNFIKPEQFYTIGGDKLTLAEGQNGFKHITIVK